MKSFKQHLKESNREDINIERLASKSGYNIRASHKTDESFNKFSLGHTGKSDYGYAGVGFYFTPKGLSGLTYGKNSINVFLKLNNPYKRTLENWKNGELSPYLWIINRATEIATSNGKEHAMSPELRTASTQWTNMMQKNGYDGFIDEAMDNGEIVVFKPERIKLSDPITYDDDGNEIPLNKRFDETTDDMRY